jgi:hypothetical protein
MVTRRPLGTESSQSSGAYGDERLPVVLVEDHADISASVRMKLVPHVESGRELAGRGQLLLAGT